MQRLEHEVSGHDFSRAVNATNRFWALAPEGRFHELNDIYEVASNEYEEKR